MTTEKAQVLTVKEFRTLPQRQRDEMAATVLGKHYSFPGAAYDDGGFWTADNPARTVAKFRPCTNIAAAWQVVQGVTAQGWTFAIEQFDTMDRWGAYFKNKATRGRVWGNADTAQMAIVIAALLAVGALVEGNGDQS